VATASEVVEAGLKVLVARFLIGAISPEYRAAVTKRDELMVDLDPKEVLNLGLFVSHQIVQGTIPAEELGVMAVTGAKRRIEGRK